MAREEEQAEAPQLLNHGFRGRYIPGTIGIDRMADGRYRTRTWLRGHLPYALTWLAPKGQDDCGNHEWYRQDDTTAACYHCDVGEHPLAPDDTLTPDGIVSAPKHAVPA